MEECGLRGIMKNKEKKPTLEALKKAQETLDKLYRKEPSDELLGILAENSKPTIAQSFSRFLSKRRLLPTIR